MGVPRVTRGAGDIHAGVSRSSLKRRFITGILAVLSLTASDCASVKVRKVPTPTQYVHWTDAMQEKADRMEGLRFYLPRPFINVFESFPILTEIYIADGVVSPDGKYVIIKKVRSQSHLNKHIAGLDTQTTLPTSYIKWPKPEDVRNLLQPHGAAEDTTKKDGEKIPTGAEPGGDSPAPPAPTPKPLADTGLNSRKTTNDNGAYAYQPMRGNLDIAYLPDFEEQYVVTSRAGLGNAQFELNLGQGWSLQGLNSLSDNRELNRRIFNVIDTAIEAAKAYATAQTGIPFGAAEALPGTNNLLKPHGASETNKDAEKIPGTPVSLKIVVVNYAAKGIYPVIKPRELQERLVSQINASGAFNFVLDLFRAFPVFMESSDFDSTAITRAQQAIENQTEAFSVPRYPYQYVSFNTFKYMAIEVLKPETSPFGVLYDKTGTTGDPGDRRTTDLGSPSLPKDMDKAGTEITKTNLNLQKYIAEMTNEKLYVDGGKVADVLPTAPEGKPYYRVVNAIPNMNENNTLDFELDAYNGANLGDKPLKDGLYARLKKIGDAHKDFGPPPGVGKVPTPAKKVTPVVPNPAGDSVPAKQPAEGGGKEKPEAKGQDAAATAATLQKYVDAVKGERLYVGDKKVLDEAPTEPETKPYFQITKATASTSKNTLDFELDVHNGADIGKQAIKDGLSRRLKSIGTAKALGTPPVVGNCSISEKATSVEGPPKEGDLVIVTTK